ncbi:DNA helicase [Nitzschia inconspicua]|uniref:DNA helicase n=1 Tax=Nitzschia inconspicua TaxID=303405 RepID=A0A9K3KTT3_9STRA|nr:DNA helicase [Nitzschia inconspicua]
MSYSRLFHGMRGWTKYGNVQPSRAPRPSQALAQSILMQPTETIASSTENQESFIEYRRKVFSSLGEGLPTALPNFFSSMTEYQKSLASLVVEETIHTVISSLDTLLQSLRKKNRKKGVYLQIDERHGNFFKSWTKSPLNAFFRRELKAGTVILVLPKGEKPTVEKITLGIIQVGSTKSTRLPWHLSNGEKWREGDQLKIFIYRNKNGISKDDQLEIVPVSSILNYQRQYTACKEESLDEVLGNELLGKKNDSSAAVEGQPWANSSLDIDIPHLNVTQEKAAKEFVQGIAPKINIVQGPPGTGKTTMTCAIICRYLATSKSSDEKKKLLVCGPTNKSVIVLARKVLKSVEREKSLNVVIIGDTVELLSDNPELRSSVVYTYFLYMQNTFLSVCEKLQSDLDITRFSKSVDDIFEDMNRKTPSTNTTHVQNTVKEIVAMFEEKKKPNPSVLKSKLEIAKKKFGGTDTAMIVKEMLETADVVFCTLSSAGNADMRKMGKVSDLIVDEAAACTESEILIPICAKPGRMLLVGDPKQLPATVKSDEAKMFGFHRSLQERLMISNDYHFTLLDTQYRMKPAISHWPNAKFYDSKVQDGDNVKRSEYGSASKLLLEGEPYTWVPIMGKEAKDASGSTYNEREVEAVVSMILDMKTKHKLSDAWLASPDHVRIMTFYKAQESLLVETLKKYGLNVTVSTVDAGQGCEANIVILSFVRGTLGQMGFICDMQRLNVALTRAKYQLVCVGDVKAMAKLEKRTEHLQLIDMANDADVRADMADEPGKLPPPPPPPLPRPSTEGSSKSGEKRRSNSKKKRAKKAAKK